MSPISSHALTHPQQVLFDKLVLTKTPIESLKLLGSMESPLETLFPLIVAAQSLGWYDTVRHATLSGRAELVNNLRFLHISYDANSSNLLSELRGYAERELNDFKKLTTLGFVTAQKNVDRRSYDQYWPKKFGLENMIDKMRGNYGHAAPSISDEARSWSVVWRTIADFYKINGL